MCIFLSGNLTTMEDERVIVLTSLANQDLYPQNRADAFTNKLQENITLNANLDYEVALVDVFLPKEVYGIKELEDESSMQMHVTKMEKFTTAYGSTFQQLTTTLLYTYKPKQSIITTDMRFAVSAINEEIKYDLQIMKSDLDFSKHISPGGLFYYDEDINRVTLNIMKGPLCTPEDPICALKISFGTRLAGLLGYSQNTPYQIFNSQTNESKINHAGRLLSPFPPSATAGADYIIINSDIVEKTPFGGQQANVIDILSYDTLKTRSYHSIVYYKLNTTRLSSISIKIVDQNGNSIGFKEHTSTICVLHIRAKTPI